MKESLFEKIRVRSLIFFILFSVILIGVIHFILLQIFPDWFIDPLSGELISLCTFELSLIGWLVWLFKKHHLSFTKLIRFSIPSPRIWIQALGMLGVSMLFSLGAYSVIYFLLSFLFPDFVLDIINDQILSTETESSLLVIYNIAQVGTAVILAPILEEIIFRGILLHRWSKKWNITAGLLLAATLFGIVHIDFFGSFIFALIMSIFYIKTKTLVLPIALHFINNLIAFSTSSFSISNSQPAEQLSLQDFREGISFGIISLVLTIPILLWFFINNWPKRDSALPYYSK